MNLLNKKKKSISRILEKKIQQYKVYCVRFNYSDELLVKSDCIEKP